MRKISKILGIITIVALLLGGGAIVPALALTEVPVTINAPDQVAEDSDFTAAVDIGDVVDLLAAEYDVSFDNTVLRLDGITSGQIDDTPIPVPTGEIAPQEIEPGHWKVVQFMGLDTVSGYGSLAVLHFHVIGSTGESSAIDLSNGMLVDMEGEIPSTWTGDSVDIGIDETPPIVDSVWPEAEATNVAIDAVLIATFDEAIEEGDNFSGIAISEATGVSASIDGTILTITHDAFAYETGYTVTIPAGAVNDLAGNPLAKAEVWSFTTATEAVAPVSFPTTLLEGWNLLSTPIKLAADSDAVEQIFDAESFDNIEASYRWDVQSQQWKALIDYEFSPLEAIYIKVSSGASATAEFIPSAERSEPPSRQVERGLNLIGPAPALEMGAFPDMSLDEALASIAEAEGGLRGYTMVVSPAHNQLGWAYGLGGEVKDLLPYKGYWVVMENGPDILFGFSTTPIP